MYRSGLVNTLVTHANMRRGLALIGDRRGFMPPQLKTNKTNIYAREESIQGQGHHLLHPLILRLLVLGAPADF